MSRLDPTSLIASQMVLFILYVWIFYFIHRVFPYVKGARVLAVTFLVAAVARLFFILPILLESHFPLQMGDALVLVETAMVYIAILRYFETTRPLTLKIIGTMTILMSVVVLISPLASRYVPTPWWGYVGLIALIRGLCARELFLHAIGRPAVRIFAIFMAFYSFYVLIRRALGSVMEGRALMTFSIIDLLINISCSDLMGFFLLFLLGSSIIQRMEQQSLIDSLTSLLNRRGIEAKLGEEVVRSARNGYIFSVALIDLDHFKSINDTFGHAAGDSALCYVANMITSSIREYDSVGRLGGDEMLLIMPSTNGAGAMLIADRICQSVKNVAFSKDITLSTSIGIAQYEVLDSSASVLARADTALYQAKAAGRGCARFQTT